MYDVHEEDGQSTRVGPSFLQKGQGALISLGLAFLTSHSSCRVRQEYAAKCDAYRMGADGGRYDGAMAICWSGKSFDDQEQK